MSEGSPCQEGQDCVDNESTPSGERATKKSSGLIYSTGLMFYEKK